jgi:hypothetical protein
MTVAFLLAKARQKTYVTQVQQTRLSLHAYSWLINSKPFSLFLYYFTPYVFVEGFRREDPRKKKDHAFRHLTVPQIYTHGRIYLGHLFVASDLPPT